MQHNGINHPVKQACLTALVEQIEQVKAIDVLNRARQLQPGISAADGGAAINAAKRQVISVLQNQIEQHKRGGAGALPPLKFRSR